MALARVTPLPAGKEDGWMNRQRESCSFNPPLLGEGLARIYRGILAVIGALRPAKEPPSAPGDLGAASPVPPKQFTGRRGSCPAPVGKRWGGPGAGDTSRRGTLLGWAGAVPRWGLWAGSGHQLSHPSDLLGSSPGKHFPGICCCRCWRRGSPCVGTTAPASVHGPGMAGRETTWWGDFGWQDVIIPLG